MPRHPAPPPVPRNVERLRVNDLLFIDAYLSNGRNAVDAYRQVHPKAKYTSASASSCKLLGKNKVKLEIARRIQTDGGITRAFVESGILEACRLAREARDPEAIARTHMDAAKLAGFLVEKREDVTPASAAGVLGREAMREELRQCLVQLERN